ncbi:MAG: hypothetical protein WC966_08540 [Bradymonadales bacterium]
MNLDIPMAVGMRCYPNYGLLWARYCETINQVLRFFAGDDV